MGYVFDNIKYLWEHLKTHDLKSTLKAFFRLAIYVLIIELVAVIILGIWHSKKHLLWIVPLSILFLWWFFASGIYIWFFSIIGIILVCVLCVIIWGKVDRPVLLKSIVAIGLVLCCVSCGLYFFRTDGILQDKQLFSIINTRYYIDEGIFSDIPYLEYEVLPNKTVAANVDYQIIVDNGKIIKENNVRWSQIDLDDNKFIKVRERLSLDEYNTLKKYNDIEYRYIMIVSERNFVWWFLPIGYILILGICFASLVYVKKKQYERRKAIEDEYNELERMARNIE